jgi:hypothetical protein
LIKIRLADIQPLADLSLVEATSQQQLVNQRCEGILVIEEDY